MFAGYRFATVAVLVAILVYVVTAFSPAKNPAFLNRAFKAATSALLMTEDDASGDPLTFREAEILGLKFMQEGDHRSALTAFKKGLKLPGSRPDVKRSKSLSGPSPVGGSTGGFESLRTMALDEFEVQAAHYNMACAYAQLGELAESVNALETAFDNGFDNYATVRGDPDLDPIKDTQGFQDLMQKVDPRGSKKGGGFNTFGFFGSKA